MKHYGFIQLIGEYRFSLIKPRFNGEPMLNVRETCRSLFHNYYTPIKPDFSTKSLKFKFKELIRRVSLSIAFDSPEI